MTTLIWTDADNTAAAAEGWNLFSIDHTSGPQLDIQREDEKAIFGDDGSALMHVYKHAMEGSVLHQKALQMSLQTSPAFIPARVGVNYSGGVVQSVFCDQLAELMMIDYEHEYSDDETLVDLPQDDGTFSTASVIVHTASVMPGEYDKYAPAVEAAYEARDAARPGP